jgi:hypothetical protein
MVTETEVDMKAGSFDYSKDLSDAHLNYTRCIEVVKKIFFGLV